MSLLLSFKYHSVFFMHVFDLNPAVCSYCQEKNESIENKLESFSKRQKLPITSALAMSDASNPSTGNGSLLCYPMFLEYSNAQTAAIDYGFFMTLYLSLLT